jgi:hypothetical protein
MSDSIFQPTDLAQRRVEFLEAAREGVARLRDKDGTSLVMLPERRLRLLEELAEWSNAHLRLEELLRRGGTLTVGDLGPLAWLRVFDREDLTKFLQELHDALVAAHADNDSRTLDACLHAWRVTASQLEDPLRRSVLLGDVGQDDLVEVDRPDGS